MKRFKTSEYIYPQEWEQELLDKFRDMMCEFYQENNLLGFNNSDDLLIMYMFEFLTNGVINSEMSDFIDDIDKVTEKHFIESDFRLFNSGNNDCLD